MDFDGLVAGLTDPASYPHPVDEVDVRRTHLSVVLLAGAFAYKLKRAVNLGFVDFRDPAVRRRACEDEVRLNSPLAPGVYHGLVPVTCRGSGLQVGEPGPPSHGEVIEWLVRMERLPDGATLEAILGRGELTPAALARVADRLVVFHGEGRGPVAAPFAGLEVVTENARDNLRAARADLGRTLTAADLGALGCRLEEALNDLAPLIAARAARGVGCELHGDLRLEHVYLLPDRTPPADLIFLDRVEFCDRFRLGDPVADVAFLRMDLLARGEGRLADVWQEAWLRRSGDHEGLGLMPFYVSYRAAVRAKVEGLRARAEGVSRPERTTALARAERLWRLALEQLEVAPARNRELPA